ncbi:MAG: CRISPR-associated endonuclease Cas1 [Myxococcota bacterium]|jgi:CRISPR-associated protein Cas1
MKTAFVVQSAGVLRRDGARVVVEVGHEEKGRLATEELEQLVVMGDLTLTPAVIDLLVERGVDVVLLTRNGRFRARVGRGATGNVRLRLAQYELVAREPARCLGLARAFVAAKVSNQRVLLLRQARRGGAARFASAARAMRACLAQLPLASTLDEVRGIEGAAASVYFRAFGLAFDDPAFRFEKRTRRPPLDPVNALLSLGYTLLLERVRGAVEAVGLDPELGVLHAPQAGRPSLVLDLMEELRTPLVDALVVAAVNLGAIEPGHFEDAGPGEPVVVRREGLRRFAELFGRRLERRVRPAGSEERVTFRHLMFRQAQAFARAVSQGETYSGYMVR